MVFPVCCPELEVDMVTLKKKKKIKSDQYFILVTYPFRGAPVLEGVKHDYVYPLSVIPFFT